MLSNENSFWEFSAFCPFNDSIGFQRIYVSLFREILRNNSGGGGETGRAVAW